MVNVRGDSIMGLNRVELIGYIGTELKLITLSNGGSLLKIRLVTYEYFSSINGSKKHIEWHTLTFFGRNARSLKRFGRRGLKIYIDGHLRTYSYIDKEGERRYSTEIVVVSYQILSFATPPKPIEEENPPFPLERDPIDEDAQSKVEKKEEVPF